MRKLPGKKQQEEGSATLLVQRLGVSKSVTCSYHSRQRSKRRSREESFLSADAARTQPYFPALRDSSLFLLKFRTRTLARTHKPRRKFNAYNQIPSFSPFLPITSPPQPTIAQISHRKLFSSFHRTCHRTTSASISRHNYPQSTVERTSDRITPTTLAQPSILSFVGTCAHTSRAYHRHNGENTALSSASQNSNLLGRLCPR